MKLKLHYINVLSTHYITNKKESILNVKVYNIEDLSHDKLSFMSDDASSSNSRCSDCESSN